MFVIVKVKKLSKDGLLAKPEILQKVCSTRKADAPTTFQRNRRKSSKKNCSFKSESLENKVERPNFNPPQMAMSRTKHTIATSDIRITCRKLISKPIHAFEQEPRSTSVSQDERPGQLGTNTKSTGPLTIVTDHMLDSHVDQAIADAKQAQQGFQTRDENSEIFLNHYVRRR